MDRGAFFDVCRYHAFSALFVIVLIVHTSVAVTLPAKLFGETPLLGAVWAGTAFLCFGAVLTAPFQTSKAALFGAPYVALAIWIILSNTWTAAPYDTLRGSLLFSASLAFALFVAASFSWNRIIELTAWGLCSLVGISLLLALLAPEIGQMQGELQGAWSGAWAEKQSLGFHACLGMIAALAMVWRGHGYHVWWIGVVICLIAIVGSRGTTALIMAAVGLALGVWFRVFYNGFARKLIGSWVAFAGAIILVPLSAFVYETVLNASGKTDDLSGRREIWESVNMVGNMRPDHGWGYQAIWRNKDDPTSPMQWVIENAQFTPANAHSSWLDMYLQLGKPGVVLLAICLLWAWAALIIKSGVNNRVLSFCAASLGAITFISFSETNLAVPMEFQWFLVTLIGTKLYLTPAADHEKKPNSHSLSTAPDAGTFDGDTFTY